MKIKLREIALIAYFFLTSAIISAGYWAYNFLNENFYQAVSQSEEIITLKKNIAAGAIDIKDFNIILEKLEKKKSGYTDAEEIKNPFK
jgi:hypothetical protein